MSDFDRGEASGKVLQRLEEHDRHFQAINGSLARIATATEQHAAETVRQNLLLQGIRDEMVSQAKTVEATAKALEKADAVRRQADEEKVAPWARLAAFGAAAAGVIGVVYTIVTTR